MDFLETVALSDVRNKWVGPEWGGRRDEFQEMRKESEEREGKTRAIYR